MEIKGVICLIVASSIQVIDDKIRFNSIVILTLGSIELISYENEGYLPSIINETTQYIFKYCNRIGILYPWLHMYSILFQYAQIYTNNNDNTKPLL